MCSMVVGEGLGIMQFVRMGWFCLISPVCLFDVAGVENMQKHCYRGG